MAYAQIKGTAEMDQLHSAIDIYLDPDHPRDVRAVAQELQSRGLAVPYGQVKVRIEEELTRCIKAYQILQEQGGSRAWAAEQAQTDRVTFDFFIMYAGKIVKGLPPERSKRGKEKLKELTLDKLLRL